MDLVMVLGSCLLVSIFFLSRGDPTSTRKVSILVPVVVFVVWLVGNWLIRPLDPVWSLLWNFLVVPGVFLLFLPSSYSAKGIVWLIACSSLALSFLIGFGLLGVVRTLHLADVLPDVWLLDTVVVLFSILVYPLEKKLLIRLLPILDGTHWGWLIPPLGLTALCGWFFIENENLGGLLSLLFFPAAVACWICLLFYATQTAREKALLQERCLQEKMERLSTCYDLECQYVHDQLHEQTRLYNLACQGKNQAILEELEKAADQRQQLLYRLSCPSKILGQVLAEYQEELSVRNIQVSLQLIDPEVPQLSETELFLLYEKILQPIFASDASLLVIRQKQQQDVTLIDLSCNGNCAWSLESSPFLHVFQKNRSDRSRLQLQILPRTKRRTGLW